MQSVSDIKRRIKSNDQIHQITKAMYLISVSKMRRAMEKYKSNMIHFTKVRAVMKDILNHTETIEHPFFVHAIDGEKTQSKQAYIVITGDKGMAGAYNHNVLNTAVAHMSGSDRQKYIFTVGQIAGEFFRKRNYNVDVEFLHIAQNPTLHNARMIADAILDLYSGNLFDEVYVVYTKMLSTVTQKPQVLRLLPILYSNFSDVGEEWDQEPHTKHEIMYEPSPKKVFDTLVPQYLIGLIYGTLVQSYVSENIARMNAMNSATRNAEEMIKKLKLEYNRARQAEITQEMTEISNGVNAQKKSRSERGSHD